MRAALAVAALTLVTTTALAQTASAEKVGFKTVLLPISVTGSTEDSGEAKVGAGAAWGLGQRLDLAATVNASVATGDGLSSLFSVKSGAPGIQQSTPWEVGVSLALARLSPPAGNNPTAGLPNTVRRRMFEACNDRCVAGADDDFCTGRAKELKAQARGWTKKASEHLPVEQFCEAQRDAVTKADGALEVPEGGQPPTPAALDALRHAQKNARKDALEQCAADCVSVESDPVFCTSAVMNSARADLYQRYDANNICAEGKVLYDQYQDAIGRSSFPDFQVTIGGAAGRQKFGYREAAADSTALLAHSEAHWHWKTGVSLFWLPAQKQRVNTTLEALGSFSTSWDGSGQALKWCTPAGDVPRVEPEPGGMVGDTDPAETCQEGVLGGPSRSSVVTASVRVGLLDGVHGSWRVAFGPRLRIPRYDGDWSPLEVAAQLPIYGAATLFSDADYKGVVRLTPSVGWQRSSDGSRRFTVGFELALLGQRRILSDRFDEL